MENKVIHLVRGIPGSGKSTFAKTLNIPDHFEADMYFIDENAILYSLNKVLYSLILL